jgi:hypothetical protein
VFVGHDNYDMFTLWLAASCAKGLPSLDLGSVFQYAWQVEVHQAEVAVCHPTRHSSGIRMIILEIASSP